VTYSEGSHEIWVPRDGEDEEVGSWNIKEREGDESLVPLGKRASLASVVLNTLSVGVKPFYNVHLILIYIIPYCEAISSVISVRVISFVLVFVVNRLSKKLKSLVQKESRENL
jgi:hypothetical protein